MNYLLHEFFYVIRDKRNGMLYAGSKFSKRDSYPELFMQPHGYQTSSPTIKQIIDECGLDVFEVVKLKLVNNAYDYETRFLRKVNAASNPKFYNAHNNEAPNFGSDLFEKRMIEIYGVKNVNYVPEIREKAIAKQRVSVKATMNDPEWQSTIGIIRAENQKATKADPEWKATIGAETIAKDKAKKADPAWQATIGAEKKVKEKATKSDPVWQEEVGQHAQVKRTAGIAATKNNEEWKSSNYKTCEHCGKTTDPGNFKQHHGDNCKLKPTLIEH